MFAVIRVVTAVFLKDTLEAAQNDAELQMVNHLRCLACDIGWTFFVIFVDQLHIVSYLLVVYGVHKSGQVRQQLF